MNVVIPDGIVVIAESEEAKKDLAHQERAAHKGAGEIDGLVHDKPHRGGKAAQPAASHRQDGTAAVGESSVRGVITRVYSELVVNSNRPGAKKPKRNGL